MSEDRPSLGPGRRREDENVEAGDPLTFYRLGRVEAVAERTADSVEKLQGIVAVLVAELPGKYWSKADQAAYEREAKSERTNVRSLVIPALVAAVVSLPAWLTILLGN